MAKEKEVALKVRPLDDRVVVEPLEAEEKTTGGILLLDRNRMQAIDRAGGFVEKSCPKHVGEELVVPVPSPAVIERNEEETHG